MKSGLKAALALCALVLAVPLLGVVTPAGSTVPGADAAVRQSGRTVLTPQIVQPGVTVANANAARLAGRISFRPARKGRPVVIQRKLPGGTWRSIATKRQNGSGAVEFTAPARKGAQWYTYRGVAKRWNALRMVRSTAQSAAVWRTAFVDQFAGTTLSPRWSYRQVGMYNTGRTCSASYPEAVKVAAGRVRLSVLADSARNRELGTCVSSTGARGSWYKNGHISTAGSYSFTYGVAAARVRFERPRGAHGSFWMQSTLPDRDGYGPAEDGAEIDVVEYFGKTFQQGDIYSFIHYRDASDRGYRVPETAITAARKALGRDDDWFRKYHVFSVEWTPRAYVFRVDGIRTLTLRRGVSRVPEFLVLSMLSSDWELAALDPATLPNATHVDWVRVWQR